MALPTSKVGVCNLALDLLKEKPISDIDTPTTDVESLCSRWYDTARMSLIQSRNWSFATKSEAISRGGAPAVSIYADYYSFPTDYLKLIAIVNPRHSLTRYQYHIEAGKLLMDNSGGTSLDVWFLFDQTDVTTFPPLFIVLLAARLALLVSYKITAKPQVIKQVKDLLVTAEKEALAANGQERPPTRYENSVIVSSGLFPSTLQQVAGDYEFDFVP